MRDASGAGPRLRYLSADDAAGKRDILTAALHLFVRDGLCETTIRDIAKSAGYSNPVLFKHFDSKDHLALHLFEQCYLGLFAAVAAALVGESGFRAQLRALIETYLNALDEDRDAVLFVQDNLRHFWPRVAPQVRSSSIVGQVHALLERGRRAKQVTDRLSLDLLTVGWLGILQQFGREWYFGDFKGKAIRHRQQLEELLLRMAEARGRQS
jgi:AcrR family transcriptional regulator